MIEAIIIAALVLLHQWGKVATHTHHADPAWQINLFVKWINQTSPDHKYWLLAHRFYSKTSEMNLDYYHIASACMWPVLATPFILLALIGGWPLAGLTAACTALCSWLPWRYVKIEAGKGHWGSFWMFWRR